MLARCRLGGRSLFLGNEPVRTEPISPQVAADADSEIRRFIEEAEARARSILAGRRSNLERLARLLLERETLERTELEAALAAGTPGPKSARAARRKARPPTASRSRARVTGEGSSTPTDRERRPR